MNALQSHAAPDGPIWSPHGGAAAVLQLRLTAPRTELTHPTQPARPAISVASAGPPDVGFPWASVTKLVTTLACLVAVEEGTVALTDAIETVPGAQLAHLLSHASGLGMEATDRRQPPESRRVYSNEGIRVAANHVESQSGMTFAEYVRDAVLTPLGMNSLRWEDPAAGAVGTLVDLVALSAELLAPTLIAPSTLRDATRPWWPELDGVVPGFGLQRPCPWGLGFELHGTKDPHWIPSTCSPGTFGHFGQSGAMLAVDPDVGQAWCSLSPLPFGPWAHHDWPRFISDTRGPRVLGPA